MWEAVISQFGRVHILINNAAIARGKPFRELTFPQFEKTIHINFLNYVHLAHLFLKQKVLDADNQICNMISIMGF